MFDGEDLFSGRVDQDFINLTVGAPGPETLRRSAEIFASASQHRVEKTLNGGSVSLFQYGPPCGPAEFLGRLAEFLSQQYNDEVKADSLMLTCGATNGLHLASTTLLQNVDKVVIFVECPTYFIATDVLKKDLNLRLVPVAMQQDGVDVVALEAAVEAEFHQRFPDKDQSSVSSSGRFWAMFYTIPTFHNPAGILYSAEKSRKIIQIARKYDMLVFCDDVYNLLYYDTDTSPKRLLAYDVTSDDDYDGGRVVSNGTFSKILSPGIRVGWIEAGPRIRDQLKNSGVLSSGGSLNNVMSGFISSILELGLQKEHVEHLRQLYRSRICSVKAVFDQNLPKSFECKFPGGGYFLWVTGPKDFDAKTFSQFCKDKHKVFVLPGSTCCPCDPSALVASCSNAFRVSIAYYEEANLVIGAERLCQALGKFAE